MKPSAYRQPIPKASRAVLLLLFAGVLLALSPPPAGAVKPVSAGSMEYSIDRPGLDYRSFDLRVNNPAACRDACLGEARCQAWTFVRPNTIQGPHPRCWLKYDVPQARRNNCCVSGVKAARVAPAPGPAAGRSRAECEDRFCPQCRKSVNLLGVSADPDCERCLKANARNIQACMAGSGGNRTGGAVSDSNRTGGAVTGSGARQSGECYVASNYDRPPRYAVACNGNDGPATWKLGRAGYSHVVMGPTTWDDCRRFMRSKRQPGW
jgi:hypothetical protein